MKYDLIIIGAGPGGYVAAIRAGQVGLRTLVIDKKYIGGMCLNWGCMPSQILMESARLLQKIKNASEFGIEGIAKEKLKFNWQQAVRRAGAIIIKMTTNVESLWKLYGIEFLQAEATIVSPHEVEADNRILEAGHILLATGSKPMPMANVPAQHVIEIENLLKQETLPDNLLVYGQGGVLVEMAQFFSMLGKKVVVVVADQPILPKADAYLNDYIVQKLRRDHIPLHFGKNLEVIAARKARVNETVVEFDKILNCNWRQAILPKLKVDLETDGGYISVNGCLQTSIPNIYAVGDVNGKSYLAHAASAEGVCAVNHIKGIAEPLKFHLLPVNIYTSPEISQIGLTEAEVKARNVPYKISEFSLVHNAKALARGSGEGIVRIIHETKYGEVLGVQMICEDATDLIAEAGVLLQMEGTVFDMAKTVHSHPTFSEIFMEAAGQAGQNL